ncbi:hypothetical protein AVEN_124889-1 [Araneus ventricosus]|uniref:Uncharacterized protein n=1 Tax=Araneus ventricosus TaxID=182803 RepID=A0A4Y2G037_ARAVE|nr:hypothetical protein AVEN_124889-1 [Araneus ventricosus]
MGHSPLGHSTFFGTQHAKPLHQCEKPMIIGVDRGRVWKFNVIVFPFSHKSEMQSFKVGESSFQKVKNHPCGGRGMWARANFGEIKAGILFEGARRSRVETGSAFWSLRE